MLCHAIYSSRAVQPMSAETLQVILDDARAGNEARDITGALVYADGVFLQILEGEQQVVRELLGSIERDTRHGDMKLFYEAEVPERVFGAWRMAYLASSAAEIAAWGGLPGTASIDELLEKVHRDAKRMPRLLVSLVEALAATHR